MPEGRAANHAFSVVTFSPPSGAPLPGAVVSFAVIASPAGINIIHQDHDYSHLPQGQPHYRLPETYENVRLAGGKLTIFELDDTNRRLVDGRLGRHPFSWERFKREAEIFPLVTLRSKALGWLAFAVFHPKKAYAELRKRAAR